jgi:WD40-like Beta Propeller Repeat
MRKYRISATTFATLFALSLIGVAQVWAQNGVISFQDLCTTPWRAYVMHGEAESETSNPRIALPEEPVPQPPPPFPSQGLTPLDISTSGPVTVLLRGNFGLYVVQVDDIGGNLTPGTVIPIGPPAFWAKFSRLPADRVALLSFDGELVVADIVRDASLKITGLANSTVVHPNLFAIGDPLDSNITSLFGVHGYLDFSPNGTQIVVTIHADLWLLTLSSDGYTLLSSEPLTRTIGDSEWQAAFSPDGNKLAYIGGPNSRRFGEVIPPDQRSGEIFTLDLGTGAVTQLTGRRSPAGPQLPAWSPDGQFLAFTAQGERVRHGSDCSNNYDIYKIEAGGQGNPTLLTNTVGTGFEVWSQWGW